MGTRLYIPTIERHLTLATDWHFGIIQERRNDSLAKVLNLAPTVYVRRRYYAPDRTLIPVSLPAGTVLTVKRIYIRGADRTYDSITFRIVASPLKKLKGGRFFVSLTDANTLEYVEDPTSIDLSLTGIVYDPKDSE